ncbi:MAG: degQ [Geobacteraceae bacterium]|nr:degQ [Geobacteraceae bacterium]
MSSCRFVLFLVIIISSLVACKKKEEPLFYESGRVQAPVKEPAREVVATQQAFIAGVQKVTPSVVNISTIGKKKIVRPMFEFSPFFDDFLKENPQFRRDRSLGSGFIINREGYILTNDHVVRDAETIKVRLSNEKVYDGRVVGSDPKTDIAVIKIHASEELPVAVLGDSDKLEVGQWAIAIGNPFGLSRTVTVGVVSATGRSGMGIETYEDFIQTDAAINPGNSGGPLLNVHGEVIGINTAIVAAGQGIGFAIPVNMVKQIIPQLIRKGSVSRGWLGVSIQPVTEELARSFGLKSASGALVSEVMAGSPAAKAGIRQGDVIVRFAGKPVKDVQHLQRLVAETPIGGKAEAEFFRAGKLLKLSVVVGSAESQEALQARSGDAVPSSLLGMTVEDLPRDMRTQGIGGVLVTGVEDGSMAAEAGIQGGDIIVAVDQKRIANLSEYVRAMKDAEKKGSVALLVKRGGASIYFALRIR